MIGQAIDDARGALPSVLLVGGEAGIGKSTLVRHAAGQAGAGLYLGRCVHLGGEVIPLAPLVDLLRQVRGAAPDVWAEAPEFASLSRWLTPRAASPDGAPEPGGVFGPVLELIGRLAGERTVLVGFEDLHWADTMTWNLFEFLARNLLDEHTILVGTYRADEVWAIRCSPGVSPSSRAFPAYIGSTSKAWAARTSTWRSRPCSVCPPQGRWWTRCLPGGRQPVLHPGVGGGARRGGGDTYLALRAPGGRRRRAGRPEPLGPRFAGGHRPGGGP